MNFEEMRLGIGVSGVFTRCLLDILGQAHGSRVAVDGRGKDRDLRWRDSRRTNAALQGLNAG
jgi:hypothetical protein